MALDKIYFYRKAKKYVQKRYVCLAGTVVKVEKVTIQTDQGQVWDFLKEGIMSGFGGGGGVRREGYQGFATSNTFERALTLSSPHSGGGNPFPSLELPMLM